MSGTFEKADVSSHGRFAEMLTVLFIGLKLTGHVGWSWWWVLSPMLLQFVILGVVAVVGAGIVGLAGRVGVRGG